jgi:hypothetical protein
LRLNIAGIIGYRGVYLFEPWAVLGICVDTVISLIRQYVENKVIYFGEGQRSFEYPVELSIRAVDCTLAVGCLNVEVIWVVGCAAKVLF